MHRSALTPGFRFKDNKLYIFTDEQIMLICGWPEPSAVCKFDGDGYWDRFEPTFRLVKPYRRSRSAAKKSPAPEARAQQPAPKRLVQPLLFDALPEDPSASEPKPDPKPKAPPLKVQRKRAFDSFRFALPKEVANHLQRYQAHQWPPLLLLAHGGKAALDLFESNSVLAFLVAHSERVQGRHQTGIADSALWMVNKRQRDILARLGFPDSNSAVKTLRKTVPEAINPENAAGLRRALAVAETAKLLSHLTRINAGVLGLIADARIRPCITPKLLEEVAAERRQTYRAFTAGVLTHAWELLTAMRPDAQPPSFRSVVEVEDVHDRLAEEYCEWNQLRAEKGLFPPPPIPGTKNIRPLLHPTELKEEGRQQHNCVASYANDVVRGRTYIYRVLTPQHATLSIVRGPGGDWEIEQLKGPCNQAVQKTTRQAVRDWLARYAFSV